MSAITAWAIDVATRAAKTFAQALVGMLGAGAFNVIHVDWRTDLGVAAGAALVSVLQNVMAYSSPTPTAPAVVPANVPVVSAPMLVTPPARPLTILEPPAAGLSSAMAGAVYPTPDSVPQPVPPTA